MKQLLISIIFLGLGILGISSLVFAEDPKATKSPVIVDSKLQNYAIETRVMAPQTALVIKSKAKVEEAGPAIATILKKVETFIISKKMQIGGAAFTRTFKFEKGILEFESGYPVPPKTKGEGEIVSVELPKGKVVTTTHIGPQDSSEKAYEAIHAWMEKNKAKEAGAPWEVYLSGPGVAPEKAKMRIFFPVN